MKFFAVVFFLFFFSSISFAQVTLSGKVINEDGEAIIRATIKIISLSDSSKTLARTDSKGAFESKPLTDGKYEVLVSYVGYADYKKTIEVEDENGKTMNLTIQLQPESVQENDIVVSATRTARNIADVPIRVEVIPAEDLQESITTGVSSAKSVLSELPGIMAQTTSSASGASTIRMRGLDGRYTQILVDGIPAFGGLNMNFSILQLPPLNLRQLEIIKGSASGIHGADAIGGIINFLTKNPMSEDPDAEAVVNYSSLAGGDLAGYYAQKFDELGVVFHATYNRQERRDVDHDGYADIPFQERIFLNPKITYSFSPNSELMIAPSYTHERRLGGEIAAPMNFDYGSANIFSTALTTDRVDVLGNFSQKFDEHNSAILNSAVVHTQRKSYFGITPFDGTENILYGDAQWNGDFLPLRLLAGVSGQSEKFQEDSIRQFDRSFSYSDLALFGQAEYAFSPLLSSLASLHADFHNIFGTILSPRATVMLRPTNALTFRLSAGTGWRVPTIFDEDAEERGFRGVPPLVTSQHERSESYTAEGKYKFMIGEWTASADLNIFQTSIYNRIGLVEKSGDTSFAWQPIGTLRSRGAEIIAQAHGAGLDLFFGYTYAFVRQEYQGVISEKPFTPASFINASVQYFIPEKIRVVTEFSYESRQPLPPNPYALVSPDISMFGASVEVWLLRNLSIFLNAENIFDARQTKTMPIYLGMPGAANFDPNFVWGPTEGRMINGGVKYKL